MPANESLLYPSTIRMYGRPFAGLELGDIGPLVTANNDLQRQLVDEKNERRSDLVLARIYGFVYEGDYYALPKPCIYIVRGNGIDATNPDFALGFATDLMLPDDFRMWEHDKADMTIRIDTEAGSFEEVMMMLLRAGAGLQTGYGMKVQTGYGMKVQTGYGMKVTTGHRGE